MVMIVHNFAAPLPDIEAGALPQLQTLHIDVARLRTTLPASWGSGPAVLPNLHSLYVCARIVGTLPPQWARGFRRLAILELADGSMSAAISPLVWEPPTTAAPAPQQQQQGRQQQQQQQTPVPAPASTAVGIGPLPTEWPSGFPALEMLLLGSLQVQGPLPLEWLREGGFRSLDTL